MSSYDSDNYYDPEELKEEQSEEVEESESEESQESVEVVQKKVEKVKEEPKKENKPEERRGLRNRVVNAHSHVVHADVEHVDDSEGDEAAGGYDSEVESSEEVVVVKKETRGRKKGEKLGSYTRPRYLLESIDNGNKTEVGRFATLQQIADELKVTYSKIYRIWRKQDRVLCKKLRISRLEEDYVLT